MTTALRTTASARGWGLALAVSLLASVAACSSPEPGVTPTTPVAIPSTVSGGTDAEPVSDAAPCETLLDSAEVAATLGAPNLTYVGTGNPLLALVGGYECEYSFITGDPEADNEDEDSSDTTLLDEVYLALAPSALTTPAALANSLVAENCDPHIEQRTGCSATVAIGDWWYSLSVSSATSAAVQKSSFEAITVQLEQALSATTAPTAISGVTPFDCSSADVGGLPVTSSRTLSPGGIGTEMFAAAFLLAGPVTCEFTTADSGPWDLTVYPSGVAAFDQCRFAATDYDPNSSLTEVEDVETVYQLSNTGDEVEFCASDGTSLVHVYHAYSEDDSGNNQDELLSALLVPVLAAAAG